MPYPTSRLTDVVPAQEPNSDFWLKHGICAFATVLAVVLTSMHASSANAVELRVLSPQAMKPVLNDLLPQFERMSGNRVVISYATTSTLSQEIEEGITADLAILEPERIKRLEEEDKILEDSLLPLAKLEIGMVIRKGDQKPNLKTVHALKETLLNAKSIASGDPMTSASGEYFAGLIERLRIADAIKPKIKTFSSGTAALEAVASGEVDIGVGMVSTANAPGIELAGVFPAQAKKSKSYAVGILSSSNQVEEAKTFSSFISSPNSLVSIKAKGFEAP